MSNIIDSIQLSGTIYTLSAQTSGGGVPESTFSAYTAATDSRIAEDEEVTAAGLNALNESLSGKQDTLIAGDNITISGNVISASGGGSITIDPTLDSGSTNAVANGAIWSATTYNKEVTLEFDNSSMHNSTNFPSGCTTVKVTVTNNNVTILFLSGSTNYTVGSVYIQKYGSTPSVSMNFTDASYSIENNDVIITYPASKGIDKLRLSTSNSITVKAVVEGAWVNENTYMSVEVDGKIKALDDKKLDATAYTPTVVDSQLNAASTNPVQNQALYDELVIEGAEEETTLTFTGTSYNYKSTNYPSGCTKVKITSPSNSAIRYYFYPSQGASVGYVHIFYGSTVSLAFDGASYSIDGGDVIITYPTVTNVGYIAPDVADVSGITVKAVTTQTTHLIDQVTANTASIATKQDTLSAGTGIDITDNVISVTGGSGGGVPESTFSAYTASTNSRISEDEEVTAAGLNAVNDKFGGLKLVKLTQAEYDNLQTKDQSTLYIIVN